MLQHWVNGFTMGLKAAHEHSQCPLFLESPCCAEAQPVQAASKLH